MTLEEIFCHCLQLTRLAVHRAKTHLHSEAHFLGRHRLTVHGHGGPLPLQQHRRLLQCDGKIMRLKSR